MKFDAIEEVEENSIYIGETTVGGIKKNIIGADSISVNPTRIAVFGVGGGGVNAINHMVKTGIHGVTLYAANTDVQTLETSLVENIIPIGQRTCRGLGVGGDPIKGAEAAREMKKILEEVISQYDMVFFASGFGGGTGTGCTPIFAEVAKELGVLTVGVITMPFTHEGQQRMANAQQGLEDIEGLLDSIVVIPNDNILKSDILSEDLNITESFDKVNIVLSNAVSAITNIITIPGNINIDFADIEACLRQAGRVSIGIGTADAKDDTGGSAHRATEIALKNEIIDQENSMTLQSAKTIIINAVAGSNVPMRELQAIPSLIVDRVKGNAPTLKFGYKIDNTIDANRVEVTIVASSFAPKSVGFGTDMQRVKNSPFAQKQSAFANSDFAQTQANHSHNQHNDISSDYIDSKTFASLSGLSADHGDDVMAYLNDDNDESYEHPSLERVLPATNTTFNSEAYQK